MPRKIDYANPDSISNIELLRWSEYLFNLWESKGLVDHGPSWYVLMMWGERHEQA